MQSGEKPPAGRLAVKYALFRLFLLTRLVLDILTGYGNQDFLSVRYQVLRMHVDACSCMFGMVVGHKLSWHNLSTNVGTDHSPYLVSSAHVWIMLFCVCPLFDMAV